MLCFFNNSYKKAVPDMVKEALDGTQKALRKERSAGTAAMIDDAISKRNEKERGEVRAIEIRTLDNTFTRSFVLLFCSLRFAGLFGSKHLELCDLAVELGKRYGW